MKPTTCRALSPVLLLMLYALLTGGCADSSDPGTSADGSNANGDVAAAGANAPLPEGLFLDAAPQGAQPIKDLKRAAKQGDEVVIRVVVGGRVKPLVEGRASATVIDAGLANSCLTEDDHCETPWDYCCTLPEDITANLANIQIVDETGRVIAADLSKHLQPLSTLVVRGTVGPRPDPQVLSINATGIYVQPATP